MAIVKTIKKGESLSFGFAFPDTYDITRLQNVKVYIGSSVYTHSMDGQKIRVVLRSNDTKLLTGTNVINLLVDDSVFGIRKVDYGALQILPTQAVFSDESFNAGYDFLIPLIVTENTISVENVLYSVIEGKAATIAVGTVTTLAAGEDATVENVGDENEAVFNFGIPQGIQGERGLQGYTPYIGENGNWFINGVDTGVQAEGDATQQWVTDNFVVKESGKSLISDTEITRLASVTNQTLEGLGGEPTVNKKTTINAASDTEFPTSKAVATALALKVDKVAGKSLIDDTEITKLATIDFEQEKTTPIDADSVGLWDSVTSIFKRATWANVKATLKTYFDTLYFKSVDVVGELGDSETKVVNQKTVSEELALKVDKVTGKSLIDDTEITRLAGVTNQTLAGLGGEDVSNKKTTLDDNSDTFYPSQKAVKTAVELKETAANKQNSLTPDGTGVKFPTVDATNAGLALKVAYADSLKYYPIINYGNRVIADSGVISDIEKLTKLYIENLKLLDNTVFMWDGSAGIKTRTSGVNQYAAKLYDMSAGNRDAAQATEANQPHTSGYIAPNEQRKLKGLTGETGTKGVTGSDIQIASSGAFTLAIAVKWNYPRTSSRIYLSATNYIELTDSAITLRGDSGNVLSCAHTFRTGLTEILIFEYSNGAGLIRVNGVEKTTTATSGAVTFGSLFLNQTSYNFDGEISKLQIANIRLSASQIQSLYNFTRLQHPEIEGINIGNQHWATSNYEGVVTGNVTVIPKVQGASTTANPELVVNGSFDIDGNWEKDSGITIDGGVAKYNLISTARLWQNLNVSVGKTYILKLSILNHTSGRLQPQIRTQIISTEVTSNGDYSWIFTAASTGNLSLYGVTTSGSAIFELDNVSLKEVGWADLTTPAWCYYDNDLLNGAIYGKEYNLYGAQAINLNAPTGYTIGTYAQWLQMVTLLGGTSIAGNKMKLNGTALWAVGNLGTNESGFTALPNGQRNADGTFSQINNKSNFWTSDGYLVTLDYNAATVTFTSGADAKIGAAVRLLRNEPVGATERNIETGYITNALGVTNLDISIPFGYQVESIRIDSETNITGLSAKLLTGALVELETLFTAKSVTANVQKVIAADADQSIQQTDAVVRINGTKADTTKRFRVWIKLTKVVFS